MRDVKQKLFSIIEYIILGMIYLFPILIIIISVDFTNYLYDSLSVFKKPVVPVDAIIVLGGGVVSNRINRNTAERVRWALYLLRNNYSDTIIFSGGISPNSKNKYSEAKVMQEYLKNFGINNYNVILEEKSINTYTNYIETEIIIQDNNYKNVILITNLPHLYRAYLTFKNSSANVIPMSVPFSSYKFLDNKSKLKFILYEFAAIISYKYKYGI